MDGGVYKELWMKEDEKIKKQKEKLKKKKNETEAQVSWMSLACQLCTLFMFFKRETWRK